MDDIAQRLSKIAEAEGIGATPDAIELVAELGDGSMRDALSLLDQCAAFGYDKLTTTQVTEIVGIADPKVLFAIADSIAKGDAKGALLAADGFLNQGKEAQNFLEELTMHFRSLLLCKSASDPAELLERTPEAAAKFQKQAETFSTEQILYAIEVLSECLAQAKWMATPQVAVEVAMVKLCHPEYSTEPSALLARIGVLEKKLARGVVTTQIEAPVKAEEEDTPPWAVSEEQPETPVEIAPPAPKQEEPAEVWEYWADALQEVKAESKLLYAFMSNAKGILRGSTVEIELSNKMAYDKIATPKGLAYLSNLFSTISGKTLKAEAFLEGERQEEQAKGNSIFDLAQKKDMLGDKLHIIQNQE